MDEVAELESYGTRIGGLCRVLARTSMSACGRSFFFMPFIDFICLREVERLRPAVRRIPRSADSFRRIRKIPEQAVRRGDRHFSRRAEARWIERRHFKRTGRGLSRAGFSDAGRPGAAKRAIGARQSMDVSRRASGRLCVAPAAGAAQARQRRIISGEAFPVLREATPVRMDLSHSGWSDIFFLGMDLPEMARVLNVSIDLAIHWRFTMRRNRTRKRRSLRSRLIFASSIVR